MQRHRKKEINHTHDKTEKMNTTDIDTDGRLTLVFRKGKLFTTFIRHYYGFICSVLSFTCKGMATGMSMCYSASTSTSST